MRLRDHLNKLEYFCLIAECGTLSAASEKALVGQPQLTRIVKQLEEILETQLMIRSAKGMTLTKTGNQLYEASRQVLASIDQAEFQIKSSKDPMSGTVTIGTYDSISRYFFPEFIKYLRATAPNIHINMDTGRSQQIYSKLKKGEVDIAVIVGQEGSTRGVSSRTVYTDSFGLYRAPQMSTEYDDNLIYFPYPANNTEESMKKFGFVQWIRCDNLETVRNLTEQSLGIGLLPHRVARESVLSRRLVAFHHPKIKTPSFDTHEITLCFAKSMKKSEQLFVVDEIERFLEIWSKS